MDTLYTWPTWATVAALVALTVLATILGYRAGRAPHAPESDRAHSVSNAVKTSVLGLVALILGFTYSMTATRFDQRQRLVLDEANAAGTCYLRAGLLPDPARGALRGTLRQFVDVRLRLYEQGLDPDALRRNAAEIDRLMASLWSAVESAAATHPDLTRNSLIVPAANDLIDLSTTRAWATRNHVPPSVILLLGLCMVAAGAVTGESFGRAGRPAPALWVLQTLLIGTVLYVVLDFDRPRRGLIAVDHQPLRELQSTITPQQSPAPAPTSLPATLSNRTAPPRRRRPCSTSRGRCRSRQG